MVKIDENGRIDIPEGSPASKFFSNENGHAQFNGRYAEVVQVTGDSKGVEHIRPLATLVGDKHPGSVVDQVSKTVIEHHKAYEITTNGYDTVQENFTEMAPVIPIMSRRSLETLMVKKLNNPNMSPMYYGGETLESMTDWLHNNPDRLKTRRKIVNSEGESEWVEVDGSPVVRSVERERSALTDYLNRESIKDPVHMQTVERIVESMSPMGDKCRVAINVPAWMEGSNLTNWLEQFTAQVDKYGNPLDPELYELNVIVNRKTGTEADDSVEVIEAFVAKFKQIHGFSPKVNYYDIELDPPNNNVGYSRKLITDAVLVRSLKRQDQASSLYIETEDADVVHADPRTVHNLIEKFDSNPQLDALRGKQDRDPSQLQNNDYLFMRMRAMQFFEVLARQKRFQEPNNPAWNYTWNRVVTGGWNTGYTAEAYADIDGYDNVVLGEDMPIGQRISMIRGDGVVPNLEVVGTVRTRSDSSPRRYIQEIINGRGAYAEFDNEEDNKEIREKSIDELMKVIKSHARISEENSADFASFLDVILGWSETVTGGSEAETEAMTRRILFMLGFKKDDYEIISGTHINFKSWQNFKSSLDRYRVRAASV